MWIEFDKYYLRVLTGFLATSDPGGKDRLDLIEDSLQALKADLAAGGQGTCAARKPPEP